MIQHAQPACTLFGRVRSQEGVHPVGVSREQDGQFQIKVAGEPVRSASKLAELLPLQVINPDAFRLLEGSPKVRRQFIDWGVFHMEHAFLPYWQRAQRCLKHRNSLLKRGKRDPDYLALWDQELVACAEQIDRQRNRYVEQLLPVFTKTLAQLIELDNLKISYYRGWDKSRSYAEVLRDALPRDQMLGFTQSGPQRADLRVRMAGGQAVEILSRGQQKLVVCALRLAQGRLFSQLTGRHCLFLIDDLPAELDQHHRRTLCRLLEQLQCQVFITCVDPDSLTECWSDAADLSMFHVEHGCLTQEYFHYGSN